MAEPDRKNLPEENGPENPESKPSYTPASFEKRAAAWMGLGYALFVLFLITFAIFTGGKGAPGTFPLLLIPAAIALLAVAVHRQKLGTAPGGLPMTVIIVIVCVAAVVIGLLTGGPALVHAIANAYT
jgi:uncharacterized membrane protein